VETQKGDVFVMETPGGGGAELINQIIGGRPF